MTGESVHLTVRPLTLAQANAAITSWHRHHKPVRGHRFSLAAYSGADLVGVCVVGRPVARKCDPYLTAEVTRLATNGHRNACSFLYGAAARAAKAMGFRRIQTYILADEPGVTLRAAGWTNEGPAGGGQWKHTDGRPRRTDQPTETKVRWAKELGV